MIDFYYRTNGFYYSLEPRNNQAVVAYNEGSNLMDMSNIPLSAFKSVKWQLKQAGYKIRKAPKLKRLTTSEMDSLLQELNS